MTTSETPGHQADKSRSESLSRRFWSFFWFLALPAAVSVLLVVLAADLGWIDEWAPWHFLMAFAVLEIVALGFRDRMPRMHSERVSRHRSNMRKIRREVRRVVKETKGLLRKHGHRIDEEVRADMERDIETLRVAIKDGPDDTVVKVFRHLDLEVEKHLAFARKSTMREYAESIGVAVLVALFLRAFVVEAFKIPSGSMIPTLEVGDHIFVNKYVFGIQVPWTTIKFLEHVREPRRGEIIVFRYPRDTSKDFIKRIVGIAGDKIEMRRTQLYVNDRPVPRCLVGEYAYEEQNSITHQIERKDSDLYVEFTGNLPHVTIYDRDNYRRDVGPWHVKSGEVFVMGDNRDNSHDSRYWQGVPLSYIKGRALFIWWSNASVGGVRLDRVGHWIMGEPMVASAVTPGVTRCVTGGVAAAERETREAEHLRGPAE
jgi:signal peptidase I